MGVVTIAVQNLPPKRFSCNFVHLQRVRLNVESDGKYRIGRRNVESDIKSGHYIHL